ncbi:MAG: hypothetical protein JWN04_3406 [Myxococcaceae bacterium]|nr:hypothetical protein [Myxococcaceae bacterium]
MRAIIAFLSLAQLLALGACAHDTIPNTDVEDTPDTRDVVAFIERYREAVVSRDVQKLMVLAAKNYYDDMGTPQGDDDVDVDGLRERLSETFGPELLAVHYDIRYRDVVFLPTKVLVDYTYIGRFRLNTPEGSRWERRLSDNRMVLGRNKDGTYAILSGM